MTLMTRGSPDMSLTADDTSAVRTSNVTDEALMARFCAGDQEAFTLLHQRYDTSLHRYLRSVVGSGDVADDLLQLTFISVVRGRGRFEQGRSVRPWLYAVATNVARDWVRRTRRAEVLTESGKVPEEEISGPKLDPALDRAVQAALLQLPEGQRLPIVMHRFEGLGFAEIAEALGISESAVKVRAHRGYERLRALLAGLKEELAR